MVGGGSVGQRTLTDAESGVGESKAADLTLDKKGPKDPASESVLIQSDSHDVDQPGVQRGDLTTCARSSERARTSRASTPRSRLRDGHAALVNADLKGDPNKADETADSTFAAVDRAKRANPGLPDRGGRRRHRQQAALDSISSDFAKAETLSIPITLLILVVAFGALVAAGIPVILAISAVMATIGPGLDPQPDLPGGRVDRLGDPADRDGRRGRLLAVLPAP